MLNLIAPAKINLFLHVVGRRENGYHEIESVFQFLDFHDRLSFTPLDQPDIIRDDHHQYPIPDNDLIIQAAKLLKQLAVKQGIPNAEQLGIRITLEKNIPPGSGLGGGSSNAATTLIALNKLWGLGLDTKTLCEAALQLGADVPVFIFGESCWAQGIGEILAPFPVAEKWYCLVLPDAHVSTQTVFTHPELPRNHRRIAPETLNFTDENFGESFDQTSNDLEAITRNLSPEVDAAFRLLSKRNTPMGARMSGSGCAVFVPCDSRAQAQAIAESLMPHVQTMVTRGLSHHPIKTSLPPSK